MDPESGLDAIRNIGIRGKRIAAVSSGPLRGRTVVDVRGLVVAPGFIDLHSHVQDDENYHYKAHDGVTCPRRATAPRRRPIHSCFFMQGGSVYDCFWIRMA
jgi:predicted amidohydrolase